MSDTCLRSVSHRVVSGAAVVDFRRRHSVACGDQNPSDARPRPVSAGHDTISARRPATVLGGGRRPGDDLQAGSPNAPGAMVGSRSRATTAPGRAGNAIWSSEEYLAFPLCFLKRGIGGNRISTSGEAILSSVKGVKMLVGRMRD
jgi:hypothetical protein